MRKRNQLVLMAVFLSAFFFFFLFARSQSFIGVNYGEVANNLPSPVATASLINSTTISKLRLYDTNTSIISAFVKTNISLLLGVPNSDIPALAASPSAASAWVSSHLLKFLPSSSISSISVGNEVLNSGDSTLFSQLLPAMKNLASALSAYPSIKISTVHSMSVLSQSDPPSSGAFNPDLAKYLDPILKFLKQTDSPFMINPYPWFAFKGNSSPKTLAFCLFQPNPGRVDSGSGLVYTNMFDAQLDAIRAALAAKGFDNAEIVVAETGWPHKGDPNEVGATVENAQAYNGNLVKLLKSMVGTPRVPGVSVETYILALYDENLRTGPTSDRSFGLYKTSDLTEIYDIGLSKGSTKPSSPPLAPHQAQRNASSPQPSKGTAAIAPGTDDGQQASACYIHSGAHLSVFPFIFSVFIDLLLLLPGRVDNY